MKLAIFFLLFLLLSLPSHQGITVLIYRDIIEKKYKGNYQNFVKGEKMILAGWRTPNDEEFEDINNMFHLRCADGSSIYGHEDDWNADELAKYDGLSVRCLKSA